jgi:hypothetical protein
MIKYALLSFCFLLANSDSHISGKFKIIFDKTPENNHTLILKNKKFKEYHGELFYSGKYSTMDLSDEKILIILENGVLKNDTTGVKYLGNTAYEIAKANSDTLLFRQFYTNQSDKIIATGKFIKIK